MTHFCPFWGPRPKSMFSKFVLRGIWGIVLWVVRYQSSIKLGPAPFQRIAKLKKICASKTQLKLLENGCSQKKSQYKKLSNFSQKWLSKKNLRFAKMYIFGYKRSVCKQHTCKHKFTLNIQFSIDKQYIINYIIGIEIREVNNYG